MSETESKESPASGTCCAGDAGECCASEFAFRTALACRPRTYANGAGDAGFLMLMGSSQHGPYFEPEEWKTGAQPNPYVAYGLPTSTSERVANAFPAFLAWTKDTRPVTTLVGANIIWELFRWGVEPGFDPDAFRAGLVSQSSNDLLKAFEDQTRALLAQTRETLAVHNRESSQACVFLRTQPVPVSFPEVGVIAGLTDLVSVLNDAVRRVADEAGAPLFDAARGSASMFPGDDRVSQSVAAAAYFEDGYHPTSEHAAALYALLREWAREALPEHCRLSEENGQ
jgi:lysophospholipase L1-like esterase